MRRGELMGLLWRNINLAKGFLDVCQSLTHVRGELHIDTPKTESSGRRVELDAGTVDILLQAAEKLLQELTGEECNGDTIKETGGG